MDNKYGLGSRRLATEHHQGHKQPLRHASHHTMQCRACKNTNLRLCPTVEDHQCNDCGEWQQDMPAGYAIGRNSDY